MPLDILVALGLEILDAIADADVPDVDTSSATDAAPVHFGGGEDDPAHSRFPSGNGTVNGMPVGSDAAGNLTVEINGVVQSISPNDSRIVK